MHASRSSWLALVLACAVVAQRSPGASTPRFQVGPAPSEPELSAQRERVDRANSALRARDFATASSIVADVVALLLERAESERGERWLTLLDDAGRTAFYAQDVLTAKRALQVVLEVRSRTLPDEHPDLQAARANLAITVAELGDYDGARVLFESLLESFSRVLPDDHPDVQKARQNLAITLRRLGDPRGARALEERVLEVYTRTLPEGHPDLRVARLNLASTLETLGDLAAVRTLQEKVLEVLSRTLPDDHLDLQSERQDLAATIAALGDRAGARSLQEKVLEVLSRSLPDDHVELQGARLNLANTMRELGDVQGALAIEQRVLEICSRTLPDHHAYLRVARLNLAATLRRIGDLAGARALYAKLLEVSERTLPDDHPELQKARLSMAVIMIEESGDLSGGRALLEKVLEVDSRTLPDEDPALQRARENLVWTIAAMSLHAPVGTPAEDPRARVTDEERCVELVGAMCRSQIAAARAALLQGSPREAEARCESLYPTLDFALSFVGGIGGLGPAPELERPCFLLSETTRGAALASVAVSRLAAASPRYAELRAQLARHGGELAALARDGTTSEEFQRARSRREAIERDLVSLARELADGAPRGLELDVDALATELAASDAIVSYRRYRPTSIGIGQLTATSTQLRPLETRTDRLTAFVLRRAAGESESAMTRAHLTRVDLGPIEPIESAVHAWRAEIGVAERARGVSVAMSPPTFDRSDERGRLLRELVFDPLRAALTGVDRVVFVPDDVLHLVPMDALPMSAASRWVGGASDRTSGGDVLGDGLRIETRITLTELGAPTAPTKIASALLVVGGVDYRRHGADAAEPASEPATVVTSAATTSPASESIDATGPTQASGPSILRGGSLQRGFADLPGTRAEAQAIAREFRAAHEPEASLWRLEGAEATRERVLALAPRVRFLHVATHGWFAPDSIRSWSDREPVDAKSGLVFRQSGAEQVRGMSPMLLCGLALAGASLPDEAIGRARGLVTADELSTLDLSNCELAVLSACDTNVGERRAGQGVASLQKALQMAGARSVITSLWKVPDEATKELMVDFYRRIWVEKKPKSQALWEAKTRLRDAKDENGKPKYTTRDWAAWVLTGTPE